MNLKHNRTTVFVVAVILSIVSSCTQPVKSVNMTKNSQNLKKASIQKNKTNMISVLNFGAAHLTHTSDANTSFIDVNSLKAKKNLKEIVNQLVAFKPTIVCIELSPENNKYINDTYLKYKVDQTIRLNYSDELNSIALEVARISGVEKVYGIDHQMGFDYPSLIVLANKKVSDSLFVEEMMHSYKMVNSLPLLKQFKEINSEKYKMKTFNFYNFLATMHSPKKQEGAEVIAQFYERNLKIYANLNDIPTTKNDRILIVMGATHTAYLDVFIKNNPKYKLENTNKFTNYKN